MKVIDILCNILFPEQPVCLFCERKRESYEVRYICTDCLQKITFFEQFCEKCGRHLVREGIEKKQVCHFCLHEEVNFDRARACALYFGGLKKFIADFKYHDQPNLARGFGFLMSEYFSEFFGSLVVDGVLPIPLHKKRLVDRGYNQAQLLAEELCHYLSLPLYDNFLIRKKETAPLYEMNYKQRKLAVKNAFTLNEKRKKYQDKSFLLIDDIFTTGSTVNEAAGLLKNKGGVRNIYVLTLATGTVPER